MSTMHEDRIATAIGWARQFPELGIPREIDTADAVIRARQVTSHARDSGGTYTWVDPEWTAVIRGRWAIDLDTTSIPKGPPRRVR